MKQQTRQKLMRLRLSSPNSVQIKDATIRQVLTPAITSLYKQWY
jgi:hypothetical protein